MRVYKIAIFCFAFFILGILFQDVNAQYFENNYTEPDLGDCFIGYLECPERLERGEKSTQETKIEIQIAVVPNKIKYGESLLFQYSLSSYDKPDEERYAFNVVNPEGVEIDSTLWFARQDSEYKFETSHPVYNIVKAGKYSLNFEKTIGMERTGEIIETVFFEITTNPPPLVQSKRGVNIEQINCNEGRSLFLRYDGDPSCVKPESIPKLIDRGWAKNENSNVQTTSTFDCAKTWDNMVSFSSNYTNSDLENQQILKLDDYGKELGDVFFKNRCVSKIDQWWHNIEDPDGFNMRMNDPSIRQMWLEQEESWNYGLSLLD